MKHPNSENPSNWQTAYTREDAFEESGDHTPKFGLVCLLVIFVLGFVGFSTFLILNRYSLHPYIKLGLLLASVIFSIVVFLRIRPTATSFASAFITDFYQPPEEIDVNEIVANRVSERYRLPPPLNMFSSLFGSVIAKEGYLQKENEWPAWSACHLGGPVSLTVYDGCALYLERGNRFSRVVGPGEKPPFLEWYETIKYVVDLRPKVKSNEITVWTKDGISIKLEIQIECRIGDPKKHDPASNLVYPYDPMAVKKAIEQYSVSWSKCPTDQKPKEFTWLDIALGQVTTIVHGYINSRMLDDLFMADRNGGQILSPNAVQEIYEKLNAATQVFGVFITSFQVLKIKLPKEIIEVQNDQWKAEKQGIATIHEGEAKAHRVRSREKARADAQKDIILAIADGLAKNKGGQFAEPVLLSLSGVLDESLHEPITRAYLAKETLETLEKLRSLLEKPPKKE